MKTRLLWALAVSVGLIGGSGLARAEAARDGRSDDGIEERVEKRFHDDAQLKGLDVDVDRGVVVLRGEVATAAEKARAERLAKDAGAARVENRLEIDKDKAARRIDDRAKARKDRIEERADREKDAVDRQADAAKDRLDRRGTADSRAAADRRDADRREADHRKGDGAFSDPIVTAKVKTKIVGDDLLDKSDINVDTDHDGVVTLRGTVPSEAARVRAVEIARRTDGVRKVVDALSIRAPVERRGR